MADVAVKVNGVYKNFVLPHERRQSIKSSVIGLFGGSKGGSEVQHALHDITFDIKKGEFFGIVGRNGSGKSTLLKMIAGIYQPSQGSITLNGSLVPFIELGVGFNPELTGRENVYLNGALLGFSKAQIDAQYEQIVHFAELERFMDQKLKNYSSGMQVRLAFSVAIVADADILLVDEVLAVGDAAFQRKCYEYFRLLKKKKKTVIFVTHDMNAVREYCDRAVLIEQSKIINIGKPADIAVQYTRLFNEPSKMANSREDSKRWGDDTVKYKDIKVEPKLAVKNEQAITITATAVAHQDVNDPVFGFSIKNQAGQMLLGTNNQIKQQPVKVLKAGESTTVHWSLPNVFADGIYIVDLAAEHDGGAVGDWWEEAAEFEVINEERTPYTINPPIDLTLKAGK